MHPILFKVGPVVVPTFAIVVLAAILVAIALVPRSARLNGMNPEEATTATFWLILVGMAGARLLHVMLLAPRILEDPRIARTILVSGGVWYGGLIAAVAFAWFYSRRLGVPFPTFVDTMAVPTIVGGGLGRMACFLSGCCFGAPTGVPWAVTFTNPVAHRLHADLPSVPIHPVQLYELVGALAIALFLDRFSHSPRRPGTIALLWFALYGVLRTVLELFRGDLVRGSLFGVVSTSQVIGVVTAAVAMGILLTRGARPRGARASRP